MNSVRVPEIERRIGERVRALRLQQAMSQAEFARTAWVAGVAWYPTTLSRVESGERPLRFSEAVVLCRTFDAQLVQLEP